MANAIDRYPTPLIFKRILKDGLSGHLNVISAGVERNIYFLNGRMQFAATSRQDERLGELLAGMGKISPSDLHKLSRIKEYSNKKAGRLLVEITSLGMQDIYHALVYQMKIIALAVFPLKTGEWTFRTSHPRLTDEQKFEIRVEELISEGVENLKDYTYYQSRFLYRAPVAVSIPESLGKLLSTDDIRFYISLTGYANVPAAEILQRLNMPPLFFWKKIALFYLLNVVDFVEFTVDRELNQNIEDINDMHARIANGQFNYYEILGLKSDATAEQVKQAQLDFARKYHPDRIQVAPDSSVRLKANRVLAEVNRAVEVLAHREKRQGYDARGEDPGAPAAPDAAATNNTRRGRELYLKANALYKLKKFREAATLMEEALRLDSGKTSYYMLAGLACSRLPEMLKNAEQHFTKAMEMEPWNADPLFAIGELYKSQNMLKKAKVCFEKALELNMEHTLAGKAMNEMNGLMEPKKPVFSLFTKKK